MTNSSLLKKIRDAYNLLTPGEKTVAEYIVKNYRKTAFLTSTELGEAAEVSDTTVIRLANSLGYNGFSEMKKALQDIVKREITPKEKLSSTMESMGEKHFIQSVYELERQNLEQTFEEIDVQTVNQVVDMLCGARKVFAMGLGMSASAVHFLSYRLKRIQKDVVDITSGSFSLVAQISMMNSEDVFIAFDFPRYSREIYQTLKFVKEDIKAATVLVTDSWVNPLQEFADVTLIAHNDSLGFTNSIIGSALVVNLLSVGVILKERQKSLASLEKVEKFSHALGHCL